MPFVLRTPLQTNSFLLFSIDTQRLGDSSPIRTCLSDPNTFMAEVEPPLAASNVNPLQHCHSQRITFRRLFTRFIQPHCLVWRWSELRGRGTWRSPQPRWLFGIFRWTIVGRSRRFSDSTALASVFSVPSKPFGRYLTFNVVRTPRMQSKIYCVLNFSRMGQTRAPTRLEG